jgi:tetrahydromethanopterin S-methyltransferase subunit C
VKPLRGILAGIALATAAAAGTLTANTLSAPPDTAWGADTIQDTAWGTLPVDGASVPSVTPLDTAWG